MNEIELETYKHEVNKYEELYFTDYLSVFSRNFKYRRPLIVNMDKLGN